jgi:hypothetical protein
MALGCNCNAGLSNTGKPGCLPIQSVTSGLIMVPLTAADGTANFIDLDAALPTWADLINEADASQRWFPLQGFENVELPKADTVFEEANSGRMVFIRQGKRSFAGELWGETPTFYGKLSNNRCVEFGVYIVDVNGNLIGSKIGDGLYPIPVDNQSFNPTYMFATDTTTSKVMVAFDFDRLFDESTMYMITPTEAGQNFNDLNGLLDVNFNNSVVTAGQLVAELVLDYGTALNPIQFTGAVAGDFNITINGVSATFTGVNETSAGTYDFDFSATTGSDVVISVDKAGYDGEISFTAA